MSFDRLLDFPMAYTKFEIVEKDGIYYAVGNRSHRRNILSLYSSADLTDWKFLKDLIDCGDMDEMKSAFQYPSVQFENDELIVHSRTAFNMAKGCHDSNYHTFHKFKLP